MNLFSINPNVLINIKEISYIEQKRTKSGVVVKVGCGGKEFELDGDLRDFYDAIGVEEISSGGQHFAG